MICSGVLLAIEANELVILHPSQTVHEHVEGEDYSAFCEVKSHYESVEWVDPSRRTISDKRTGTVFVEKTQNMLQLRFQPLKSAHAGVYTCIANIRGGATEKKSFNLTVLRPIKFGDKSRQYYALPGTNISLPCEAEASPPPTVSWTFKDATIEGDGYIIYADGLLVNNVTEDKFGNYTCTASVTTNNNGFTKSIDIELKKAIPPEITSVYKNDTVHGVMNNVVSIRCPVIGDPWPEIKWMRDGKELNAAQLNANITSTPTGSILQFVLSNEHLGSYTCKASNLFDKTSVTYTLEVGVLPAAPTVLVRDTLDGKLRLDITPNSTESLSNFRVTLKKTEEDESSWKTLDFGLKESPTNPYLINDLEPKAEYVYKVGACTEDDLCAFTNVSKITIQPIATSSTSTIHTVVTQVFILLPAFILGLMQRHRTT